MMATVHTGAAARAALAEHAGFIDRDAPAYSASARWLSTAAELLPAEPVVIVVASSDGAPAALAALGVTQRLGVGSVTTLGGEFSDYTRFPAVDGDAAVALAAAVADWLKQHRFWSLTLEQLPPDDPTLAALADLLPGAEIAPGPVMPRIDGIASGYTPSRSRRRKVQKALNRLETDGLTCERLTVSEPQAVLDRLPQIIEVRRDRDHGVGRRSQLDDPTIRSFYERIVGDAARAGRAELNLVLIDGEVGAYAMVMKDGAAHRFFDGRIAHHLQRYCAGHIADMMAVMNAAEAPGVDTFDWLRGESLAKFGTGEPRREELRATSHRMLGAFTEGRDALKARVKDRLPESVVRRLVS
jgi:CelD/BcsL family acetyltransferase involved in cellulose biosynthesis